MWTIPYHIRWFTNGLETLWLVHGKKCSLLPFLCPRWDHIWLNEGLATYLSNIGCEAMYDRSFVWPFFYYFYQRGTMIMDVGAKLKEKTTVPATSDILTYKDVQQIFIQYWRVLNRGACMLHMLRNMLGDAAFFSSITDYFTANAYSSAVSRDFWKHLEEPAKKSGLLNNTNLTIQSMMEIWVNNSGFPEVNIVTDFKKTWWLFSNIAFNGNGRQTIQERLPCFGLCGWLSQRGA